MSDISSLIARISDLTLADFTFVGSQRLISPAKGATVVAAFAEEIFQTQLLRRLEFTNSHNDILSLIIKAGRITALTSDTSTRLIDKLIEMPQSGIIFPDQSLADALPEILKQLTIDQKSLMVVSHLADHKISPYNSSLDLPAILKLMPQKNSPIVNPSCPIVKVLSGVSLARLTLISTGERIFCGDPDLRETIENALALQPFPLQQKYLCLTLSTSQFGEPKLIIIGNHNTLTGALVDRSDLGKTLARWSKVKFENEWIVT